MAKKTGKKVRKSGKTEPAKSGKARKKAKQSEPAPTAISPSKLTSKKTAISCQFCGKAMKNQKTLKLHERSCGSKSKSEPKANGLETAISELKDRFDDERDSILKTFQEKDDRMQRELEEVKTVLRMEIDRHRRELERITNVEKEVAARQGPEEQPQEHAIPTPEPKSHEPTTKRPPRAIDLIPMRVPSIPKRILPPMEEDDAIPDIDDEMGRPPPQTVSGLNRDAVEALVRDMVKQLTPESEAAEPSKDPEPMINMLSEKLNILDSKLERSISDMAKQIDRASKGIDFKRVERELEKISEKVLDVIEDSGYGESLSVSKIPPTILEIVYQAILDDVHIEIIRTKGAQDAERISRSALEEVRLKTSGSELFKYDGRKIVTDSLAKSIEANLISARQIQTTYDVLMEKLLETVPHHKAKNFKGMIKVKSQEFAVDRATRLTRDYARLEKILESTSQMVAAMSANFNSQNLGIHEKLNQLGEKDLAAKAGQEEVDALRTKLEENNERCIRLADELALLKVELEMKSSIEEKESEADAEGAFLAPGEEPSVSQPDIPEGGMFSTLQEKVDAMNEADDLLVAVLDAISRGLNSKAAIVKDTGLNKELVVKVISELVESRKVIEKKTGKSVKYTTLELELEKAKDDTPPAKEKKGGKKKAEKSKEYIPAPEYKSGVIVLDDQEPEAEPDALVQTEPEKPAEGVPTEDVIPIQVEPEKQPEISEKEKTQHQGPGVIVLDDTADEASVVSKPKPKKKEKKSKPKVKQPPKTAAPPPEKQPEKPAPEKKKVKKALTPAEPETPKPEPEPEKKKPPIDDEFPTEIKSLGELSEDEVSVLEIITEDGLTLSGIQSKVGRQMKRFALLRALRVLIDSGHVGIVPKGRMELYQKITVQQMDKKDNKKNKKEVK
ncbi:MAG: hypothetical protein KKH41_07990 [Candidatus Thermoplasmatota archaeon]|nr:hypothetical protein [Euryarchaeota archaeon]MBU4032028.1 hypothetical protein [Candidatus Thermoplasmatota archaeon]MBU4071623.1 hypothetical protein [Candidatus Thermoplasmatota archaeon]MBU4143883.1 hypothetical protein [Candidatus Thermoplasmatota archaeon]MBU4592508.1 hypothetical protein [Candidatus Thermoplasmatota archaeon]